MRFSLTKWILGVIGLLLIATVVIINFIWQDYQSFIDKKNTLAKPIIIEILSGMNFQQLTETLVVKDIIDKPYYFKWLARQSNKATQIKTGEFEIVSGLTPIEILDTFVSGKVVQYSLTLVEGWQFSQALDLIEQSPHLEKTLNYANRDEIMLQLGLPKPHPEGLFFPDTYHFPKGTTDREFLIRAYDRMDKVLQEEWLGRAESLPYQRPYQALTMASIIEKETGLASEREEIAGVFVRRLIKGMRLQTDPTVIYALGKQFDGNIRKKDLSVDSPYNTYRNHGLPPTPISLVGRAAIHAALHPADGKSLYFVAKGDGSHQFSDTLAEHNQAVATYQLKKKR